MFLKKNSIFQFFILFYMQVSTVFCDESSQASVVNSVVKSEEEPIKLESERYSVKKYWFAVIWDKNSRTASVRHDYIDVQVGANVELLQVKKAVKLKNEGTLERTTEFIIKAFNSDNTVHLFPVSIDPSYDPLIEANGLKAFALLSRVRSESISYYSSEREYLAVLDLVLDKMNTDKPFFSDMALIYQYFNSTLTGVSAKVRSQLKVKARKLFFTKLIECHNMLGPEAISSFCHENISYILNGLKNSKNMFAKNDFSNEELAQIFKLFCSAVDDFNVRIIENKEDEFLTHEQSLIILDKIKKFKTSFNEAALILPKNIRKSAANYSSDVCSNLMKELTSKLSLGSRFASKIKSSWQMIKQNKLKSCLAVLAFLVALGSKIEYDLGKKILELDPLSGPDGKVKDYRSLARAFSNFKRKEFLKKDQSVDELKDAVRKYYKETFGEGRGLDHFQKFVKLLKDELYFELEQDSYSMQRQALEGF